MKSSKDLSMTDETRDIASQMDAFQEMNGVILSVCFEVTPRSGVPSLLMVMTAFTVDSVTAERVQSACVRFSLSQLRYKRVGDAITYALYMIDAQLAVREMLGEEPK